nr:aminotransferase class IV [Myxococcales bacterium]
MGVGIRLNGRSRTKAEACVSVFDRGFLYGDSVYEVLRTYDGVPFECQRHLDRLEASALRIGMPLGVTKEHIRAEMVLAHQTSGNDDSYIRVVVTRGEGPIDLYPAETLQPTVLVLAMPLRDIPPAMYTTGAKVQVVEVVRNHIRAVDPQAKTGNYLNSVLALREARAAGAHEAILLDTHGRVAEGASSNVFAVIDGVVFTPPVDVGLLEGITRYVVMEVCRRVGRRVLEIPLSAANLREADEVFITSSIREIVPVIQVDSTSIGEG